MGVAKENVREFFNFQLLSIDPETGIVKTVRTFRNSEDVDEPFKLKVKARDNPNSTSEYNEIEAPLVVNLISEINRMVLVIGDAKPDVVATKLDTVISVLQEQTGLVAGVERLAAREHIGVNGTLEVDPTATDVWFYVIDPNTDGILPTNHTLVRR